MKKLILSLIATAVAGLLVTAGAQPMPGDNNNDTNNMPASGQPDATPADNNGPPPMPPDAGNAQAAPGDDSGSGSQPVEPPLVITPTQSRHIVGRYTSDFMPPSDAGTNQDELHLNFHNAPLEMVLNYLSDAAGFIIVLDTHINGNVTIISSHPVARPEAINLLNAELNKNGYAAIRTDERTLTIVDKNDAKTSDIPVKSGNDPDQIPKNAEIVTQIIPIRFVEARQLVSDLTSFVSPQATVVANEAGNSIVITDTQANIRHLAEIIKAIDSSAEAETEIRVFPLKYASPTDVANELSSVFPSGNSSGGNTQSPIRFGGGGFGGGGGFARFFGGGGGGFGAGAGGGNTASSSSDRIKKETQVTAVADSRIQAVIVTAPKDLMEEIANMMSQLDVPSDRDQNVYVFKMKNGDPQQVAQVLQNMFQSSSSSRGSSQTTTATGDALQTRINNNTTSTGSTTTGSSGFGGATGGGGRTGGGGGAF